MKHYIEREELVEKINASRAFTDLGIDGSFLRARALELIYSLPVANVREVKHGTWEDSVFAPGCYRCSVCFAIWERPFDYCPHCGTKMSIRTDDDTK